MGYEVPADHHTGGPGLQRNQHTEDDIERTAMECYRRFVGATNADKVPWARVDGSVKDGYRAVARYALSTRPLALANELSISRLIREAGETAASKGFHDDRLQEDAEVPRLLCLIHSEVSEAMEAHRNDEGPVRIAEELADVMIRVGDLAYWLALPLANAIDEKLEKNRNRDWKHGGKRY